MWAGSESRSIVSPNLFKNTVGKFAPRFLGYSYVAHSFVKSSLNHFHSSREQDAQEFLRYLLQGLSEDVNRIRQKPVPILINEKEEERMK